jgi:hypothetical protein
MESVSGEELEDILLTWDEALRAFEQSSDRQQREDLAEQIRRLQQLYRRRIERAAATADQSSTAQELVERTRRLVESGRDSSRADEPGEWY